jgi:predicted amidohydrolase
MSLPRVAALQMVSTHSLDHNLARAAQLIRQAAEQGAVLVVLPETFALFSASKQLALGLEESFGSAKVQNFLKQQAIEHAVWIVAGTVPMASSEASQRVRAACLVYDAQGQQVARYDKIHLFDVDVADKQGSYRESNTFEAGSQVVVLDSPVGRLGLAVCYDLRFPELFRAMFDQGVDVIVLPSAFTLTTGEAHWLPLLRARAIENQCYMVGANQGGRHSPSRVTSGGSAIIDGWGTVIEEAGKGECCLVADIDLSHLGELRTAMPLAGHRRLGLDKPEP